MFILKNLPKLENLPDALRESIFEKLFETAEIAKFNPQEQMEYQNNLKQYRDLKNALDTAREEGERKNREAIARKMKKNGMPVDIISEYTELTREEIEKL